MGVKVIETSKYQNGYGEGVCLILTQLLDKYLINQNFIFKKPKFVEELVKEIQNDFEEVILEENNDRSNKDNSSTNNFGNNTFNTFNSNFYFRSGNGSATGGKKRFSSAFSSNTQDTNANSAFSTETENFKVNPYQVIMESNFDPAEWKQEVDRVEKLLEIPEYPEFLMSASESSLIGSANINSINNFNNQVVNNDDINIVKKFNIFSNYFERVAKNANLNTLKSTYEGIDEELKKINSFERVVSSMGLMKDKIDKIQINTGKIKHLESDVENVDNKVLSLQSKLDDLDENLKNVMEKEDEIRNNTSSNTHLTGIKSKIESLREEINKMEIKNCLYQSNIWHYHSERGEDNKGLGKDPQYLTEFDDVL